MRDLTAASRPSQVGPPLIRGASRKISVYAGIGCMAKSPSSSSEVGDEGVPRRMGFISKRRDERNAVVVSWFVLVLSSSQPKR